MRGQRNCLQIADFSVQAGGYAGARAENFLQTADFSVQSGGYAGARAEKFISGSIFLCLSLAYTVARAESSAHMRSKICKKAYLFDKEKHLW